MVRMVIFAGGALMDGRNHDLNKFLSNLLNREIDGKSRISLSSAQQLKLYVWLKEQEINFNENLLKGSFKSSDLMNDDHSSTIDFQNMANTYEDSISMYKVSQIGIDIQSISEFYNGDFPIDPKADTYLKQIFSLREISYAQTRPNTLQTLTGMFCAKEAIIKCAGGEPLDIEISHDKYGRPTNSEYILSISHSNDYVVAIAIRGYAFTHEIEQNLTPENEFGIREPKKLFLLKSIRVFDLFIFFGLIINFSILLWIFLI